MAGLGQIKGTGHEDHGNQTGARSFLGIVYIMQISASVPRALLRAPPRSIFGPGVASPRCAELRRPAERKLGLPHDFVEVDSSMSYAVRSWRGVDGYRSDLGPHD